VKNKVNFAGGSPAASHFLLLRQKKVTKEKATPVCRRFAVPCVARLVRRLRNSRCALKQSSPKSPDQPPLLGGAQGKDKHKSKTLKSGRQQVAHHTEVDRQNNSAPVHWSPLIGLHRFAVFAVGIGETIQLPVTTI
jgi:hypothetical protein